MNETSHSLPRRPFKIGDRVFPNPDTWTSSPATHVNGRGLGMGVITSLAEQAETGIVQWPSGTTSWESMDDLLLAPQQNWTPTFKIGDRVFRNHNTWKPTPYEEEGRGVGIGFVSEIKVQMRYVSVLVHWAKGAYWEQPRRLRLAPVPNVEDMTPDERIANLILAGRMLLRGIDRHIPYGDAQDAIDNFRIIIQAEEARGKA